MVLFKQNPFFSTALIILLLLFFGEIIWALTLNYQVSESRQEIKAKTQALKILAQADPTPTRENLEAAQANLEDLHRQFAAFIKDLGHGSESYQASLKDRPAESQDLYFDIVAFIEEYRRRAAERGITIEGDENFGFDLFIDSGTGPPEKFMDKIYRQRVTIAYLLSKLFEAAPKKIVAVQREPVINPSQRALTRVSGDLFIVDPQVSARVPETIETMGYRVLFTGQTKILRLFLTSLATFEIPLVVRSVEVESAPVSRAFQAQKATVTPEPLFDFFKGEGAAIAESQKIPIVTDNISQFAVTLEYFEVSVKEAESEAAANTPSP